MTFRISRFHVGVRNVVMRRSIINVANFRLMGRDDLVSKYFAFSIQN